MNRLLERSLLLAGAGACCWLTIRTVLRQMRTWSFRGRVVMITGGSRGLGLVIARQLAREGAKIAICAREEDELERAAAELEGLGAEVSAHVCDISRRREVEKFVDAVRRELGAVEVLINNAGIIQVGPLETMTPDDFSRAMDVHFWGTLCVIECVLPDMRRAGEGRIVNIASIGGKIAVPHLLPYCGSKFALVGLSEGLRSELAAEGIYVTTVCPGMMRTGSYRHALCKGRHREEYAWFSIGASLPLVSMSAERAARKILHACRRGQAELILSWPAKLVVMGQHVAPELTAEVMALQARLLPSPGGIGTDAVEGSRSQSRWSPSFLTVLGERAALRNNELPNGQDRPAT